MALRFEFRKERIVLDAKFFMFKEFVLIWKYDKSKDKIKANELLRFIYLLCDIDENNPLKDVDEDKREMEAKFRAFRTRDKVFTKKETDLLSKAIEVYIKLNTEQQERLLLVFDTKADQLVELLEKTAPETVTNVENGVVAFVSNSKMITDSLTKLSEIGKNREKIVASIKNEVISERIRGQILLSPLDKGLIEIS